MSHSLKFSSGISSQPQTSTPQGDSNTFSLRTATLNRRHSDGGIIDSSPASEPGPVNRFHPYRRQFSDGIMEASGCLQQCSSSFSNVQEIYGPDSRSRRNDMPTTWDQYNNSIQSLYSEIPAAPVESPNLLSERHRPHNSLSPVQVSTKLYPNDDVPNSSKYNLQSVSSQSHQESTAPSLYPKPIYSYSILIFMALKNSKMGSLPVSEIYSFMTEHFPYFRAAPDGWKNSVRHNLSLNKCFEKVENKNGNTSRKGCLWALNPAKIEKMQEELHKWRRKDPLTVRRSMARPEHLDHLLGEKPNKLRSLPSSTNMSSYTSLGSFYSTTSSSVAPAQLQSECQPVQRSQYAHIQPQQPCYQPLTATHPSNPFALCPPCEQQPAVGIQSASGSLNSPLAGKIPPVYSAASRAEFITSPRGMQVLLEGDTSYDIDTINPSLTDLQLQGNLWEDLRDESFLSEPQVTTTTSSTTYVLQDHHGQTSCLQLPPPLSHTSSVTTDGCCKAVYGDVDSDACCWNSLHPADYLGVESFPDYLTNRTKSFSLM